MSEQQSIIKSCISDQPLLNADNDTLKNNQYAKGLVEFIKIADAPITIGIQGGWGSGKTSLINMLQRELESTGECICINVNAWQQSLFTSGASGHIAISLLESVHSEMLDKIKSNDGINPELKKKILNEDSHLQKAGKIIGGIAIQAAKIAVRSYAGVEGGDSQQNQQEDQYKPSQTLKKLRESLCGATQEVIDRTSIQRFVIFVDDLDRIQPHTAVEILDVLKNIFDIPGLVSVLAVDYDVIIKGLREKFGEKNHENEREFRQYFDKIIQIPFSMPTAAYKKNITPLLKEFFNTLGIDIDTHDQNILAKVVLKATEGVPRSVKRVVNTMSLLRIIKQSEDNKTTLKIEKKNGTFQKKPDDYEKLFIKIQFIIVCIQINFPDIHKALLADSDFLNWDVAAVSKSWGIDKSTSDEQISLYGKNAETEWQKALITLTGKHQYLKNKSEDILDIINTLNEAIKSNNEGNEGNEGFQILGEVLNSVSITSTDLPPQNKKKSNREDSVTHNCRLIAQEIINYMKDSGYPYSELDEPENQYAIRRHGESGSRTLTHETNNPTISKIEIFWEKEYKTFSVYIHASAPYRAATKFRATMKKLTALDAWDKDGSTYEFHLPEDLTQKSLEIDTKKLNKTEEFSAIKNFIDSAIEAYELSGTN
ncbi:KAP family P-loop NTPase fold protein [Pseudomonas borbori]|uniref:KAP family P-loop domain-containing protein n=1 Tax=Pseudomonas borbori TaxID=289003 RepID=A0A1I5UN59_9PSED|nr:P-loop NTPase fold protein [Pseudomonas borbori]SFP96743.1 KAP family P-loop domain-containing protein [Pseudomonas borbori]